MKLETALNCSYHEQKAHTGQFLWLYELLQQTAPPKDATPKKYLALGLKVPASLLLSLGMQLAL